jgi:hypothetical protein
MTCTLRSNNQSARQFDCNLIWFVGGGHDIGKRFGRRCEEAGGCQLQESAKDGKKGVADYEAASRAVAAKTARLRALRLAKEAADKAEAAANPVKPAAKKRAVRSTP